LLSAKSARLNQGSEITVNKNPTSPESDTTQKAAEALISSITHPAKGADSDSPNPEPVLAHAKPSVNWSLLTNLPTKV
jgi:hypothetical protein